MSSKNCKLKVKVIKKYTDDFIITSKNVLGKPQREYLNILFS